MEGPMDVTALLQSIGVVAVYAIIKDGIPRLFNGSESGNGKKRILTVDQHDKECALKLRPMKEKIDEIHKDLKAYIRRQGVVPPSDGDCD